MMQLALLPDDLMHDRLSAVSYWEIGMSRLRMPLLECWQPSASASERIQILPCSRLFAVAATHMARATTEVQCHCSQMPVVT